jgi:hypothetical protein
MNRTGRDPGARGRWLVLAIVGAALILGLVALRFRKFTPKPTPPGTTQPTSVNG